MSTTTGGIVTLVFYLIMMSYATLKVLQMHEHSNALIMESKEINFYDSSDKLNLNNINFHLAFSVENYLTKE